jgi:hypothetical protein
MRRGRKKPASFSSARDTQGKNWGENAIYHEHIVALLPSEERDRMPLSPKITSASLRV